VAAIAGFVVIRVRALRREAAAGSPAPDVTPRAPRR
jgi:hypothetical protein